MPVKAFSYSQFLRGPSEVLPALLEGDVRLDRRDEQPLFVSRQDRYEAKELGMGVAARLLLHLWRVEPDRAAKLLSEELPWLNWLPPADQDICARDLLTDLAAGAETGTLEPFARSLKQWRNTAEMWADPALAVRFQAGFPGDGPRIERPIST
jgi:hypothetical protein